MIVIGLFGKMGAGKGTASEVLKQEFGFQNMGVTDPIKCLLRDYLLYSPAELWGSTKQRNDDIRRALQKFGSCGREIDEAIWIDQLTHRIDDWTHFRPDILGLLPRHGQLTNFKIVVDDLRYELEATVLKEEYNATLIQVACPHSYSCVTDKALREHESEKAIDNFDLDLLDHIVVNKGTEDEFKNRIRKITVELLNESS